MFKMANHKFIILFSITYLYFLELKVECFRDFINEPRHNVSHNYPTMSMIVDEKNEINRNNGNPPSPIPDVSPLCQAILLDLSEKVSNFTYCATDNARPITICKSCMEHYYNYYNVYKNISVKNDNDCQNELLNRDRLMIVQSLNSYISKMWREAYCQNCYVEDGNETRLSNDTIDYFNKLDKVMTCIENNRAQKKGVKDVCQICRNLYVSLNDKYNKLNSAFNNEVCMDIVDHMNITHHLWSVEFHCVQPHFESYPVLILSGIMALIPILFYVINRLASSARESEIVLQKRMSFVQSGSHSNLQRLSLNT